ncbi:MAG TPA: hypothetical protein PLP86_08620 [Armatimonadota bacterium]|nr:hypothetical protein [Armatimonadota bacterium]
MMKRIQREPTVIIRELPSGEEPPTSEERERALTATASILYSVALRLWREGLLQIEAEDSLHCSHTA